MRDLDEEDPDELEASKFDLAYISLDGNIGGRSMAPVWPATMDTIKLFGAEPANFLDVGGGATTEKVTKRSRSCSRTPRSRASRGQHLRRHHALRHHRHRRRRRSQGNPSCPCRWSSA